MDQKTDQVVKFAQDSIATIQMCNYYERLFIFTNLNSQILEHYAKLIDAGSISAS
jgi:hypothetical protein